MPHPPHKVCTSTDCGRTGKHLIALSGVHKACASTDCGTDSKHPIALSGVHKVCTSTDFGKPSKYPIALSGSHKVCTSTDCGKTSKRPIAPSGAHKISTSTGCGKTSKHPIALRGVHQVCPCCLPASPLPLYNSTHAGDYKRWLSPRTWAADSHAQSAVPTCMWQPHLHHSVGGRPTWYAPPRHCGRTGRRPLALSGVHQVCTCCPPASPLPHPCLSTTSLTQAIQALAVFKDMCC